MAARGGDSPESRPTPRPCLAISETSAVSSLPLGDLNGVADAVVMATLTGADPQPEPPPGRIRRHSDVISQALRLPSPEGSSSASLQLDDNLDTACLRCSKETTVTSAPGALSEVSCVSARNVGKERVFHAHRARSGKHLVPSTSDLETYYLHVDIRDQLSRGEFVSAAKDIVMDVLIRALAEVCPVHVAGGGWSGQQQVLSPVPKAAHRGTKRQLSPRHQLHTKFHKTGCAQAEVPQGEGTPEKWGFRHDALWDGGSYVAKTKPRMRRSSFFGDGDDVISPNYCRPRYVAVEGQILKGEGHRSCDDVMDAWSREQDDGYDVISGYRFRGAVTSPDRRWCFPRNKMAAEHRGGDTREVLSPVRDSPFKPRQPWSIACKPRQALLACKSETSIRQRSAREAIRGSSSDTELLPLATREPWSGMETHDSTPASRQTTPSANLGESPDVLECCQCEVPVIWNGEPLALTRSTLERISDNLLRDPALLRQVLCDSEENLEQLILCSDCVGGNSPSLQHTSTDEEIQTEEVDLVEETTRQKTTTADDLMEEKNDRNRQPWEITPSGRPRSSSLPSDVIPPRQSLSKPTSSQPIRQTFSDVTLPHERPFADHDCIQRDSSCPVELKDGLGASEEKSGTSSTLHRDKTDFGAFTTKNRPLTTPAWTCSPYSKHGTFWKDFFATLDSAFDDVESLLDT